MVSAPSVVAWLRTFRTSSFFFNDATTTEIYTLSLHDALPILKYRRLCRLGRHGTPKAPAFGRRTDRKSTRLNSSHCYISYAVFCLRKKPDVLVGKIATPGR